MMTLLKRIAFVLLVPIMLSLLLGVAIYIPPIQNWVVNKVVEYATESTGLNVSIERVGLTFLIDLDMRNVVATNNEGDTLLNVTRTLVDFDFTLVFDGIVGVEEIKLQDGYINTKKQIEGLQVQGRLGNFFITAPQGIRPKDNTINIEAMSLHGCDLMAFIEELPENNDTTSTEPLPWQINIGKIRISDVCLFASMGDTVNIAGVIQKAQADVVNLNLGTNEYCVGNLNTSIKDLNLDTLSLPCLNVSFEGITYTPDVIRVADGRVNVSHSHLHIMAEIDARSIDTRCPQGIFDANIEATVDNQDLDSICRRFAIDLMSYNPQANLSLSVSAKGNLQHIDVTDARIVWDDIMDIRTSASIDNPLDSLLSLNIRSHLQSIAGNAQLYATYRHADMCYNANIGFCDISPNKIDKDIAVRNISGHATIAGCGVDVLSKATHINAEFNVDKLELDSICLDSCRMTAELSSGVAKANIKCNNKLIDADACIDGLISTNGAVATISLDLHKADLHGLHVVDSVLSIGGCIHVDAASDFKDRLRITGHINDILLIRPDTILRPVNVDMDVLMRPDSLYAHFRAGQMMIIASSSHSLEQLLKQTNIFTTELEKQMETHFIDQNVLKPLLPEANLQIQITGRNPISTYLSMMGYTFDNFRLNLRSSPTTGLNGTGCMLALNTGTMLLDTIQMNVFQDSTGVQMNARLRNGPKNKQFVFDARMHSFLLANGAGFNVTFTDGHGVIGVDVGAIAKLTDHGIMLHLMPERPILAYRKFKLNKDNYMMLTHGENLLANINLTADDGTSLLVYSNVQRGDTTVVDSLAAGDQDMTVSFKNVNLGEVSRTLPYLPAFAGMAQGDIHVMKQDSTLSAAIDASVKSFVFEKAPIGDVALNSVYFPCDGNSHIIDGQFALNGNQCATYNGTYMDDGKGGSFNVEAELMRFPLSIANGFVDSGLAQLSGSTSGNISISGCTDSPSINGTLSIDNMHIISTNYSLKLKVKDDVINVKDNHLDLDKISVYSTGTNPLVLDGWVDFSDISKINMDMAMGAKNFELINAKKTPKALAYGKVYCDVDARMRGTLNNLVLNGTLGVLGNTNVTYVLRDSPLTVEDRLSDIVTFVDFATDEETVADEELSEANVTMTMKLHIDEATQVHCLLSDNKSSYVDIEGGGELVLSSTPKTDMQLTGRYTINSGEMKYQLPVIPLKTFKFENGSYISFNGPILNPTLNLAATERMRALVGKDGGNGRSIPFDVGVKITQTLENMGLQFTIDSPEDASVHNELETMDEATRGRIAVTMLATGMYISDSNSAGGGFSTDNALNSFLQSEISNIAGKALGSIDLSFGMDSNTSATGTSQTDYSFRFAKHFWGNRVSVVLGGKVSSGNDAQNTGATIIDNISVEYRLDQSATRYVRVFYDKTYESLIDGHLTEMGAGLLLRRKTTKLGDLFIFRKNK